jgi:protein SCO1/2
MPRLISWAVLAATLACLAGCAHGKSAPDFTLTDATGHAWTLSAQRGKPVVLTFGFTHCADTCPETLAKIANLTNALGPPASSVVVAMVSVDPSRDNPRALRAFTSKFTRPIVGLTGTQAQIDAVETAYHVWAQRVPGKHAAGAYDVAHSTAIYFIDARGNVRRIGEDDDSEAALTRDVRELLA